ncbi:hypothetical protein BX666DRAFT_2114242 [Dichotomocladium elegans]|nr:hypothetical protein BX666DRAFT_2114242 [Dichotomocladium elegans]
MRTMYIINAFGSAVVSLIGVILLFYRTHYREQPIFITQTSTGFIRPKPIEAMLFMAIIYNILRIVQSIIIVTDAAANVIFRSFMYEFPWQFGLGAFACYVFGVAHAVANGSRATFTAWFSSPIRIDIISTVFISLPFVTNNVCSIAEGIYAQRGDDSLAAKFTKAHYYLWTIYCGSLGCMILVAGIKLLRLLKHHLTVQRALRSNIGKIKAGMLKVKIIMIVGCVCLWIFALIVCLYGARRDLIVRNTAYNLVISTIWTYNGLLATILVELALIINPRMTASLGVSSEGTNGSQSDQPNPNGALTTMSSGQNMVSFNPVTSGRNYDQHALSNSSHSNNNDGLPRYSVGSGDVSMEMIKSIHSSKSIEVDDVPPLDILQIERDKMNYNATTGQMRVPPRHNVLMPTT